MRIARDGRVIVSRNDGGLRSHVDGRPVVGTPVAAGSHRDPAGSQARPAAGTAEARRILEVQHQRGLEVGEARRTSDRQVVREARPKIDRRMAGGHQSGSAAAHPAVAPLRRVREPAQRRSYLAQKIDYAFACRIPGGRGMAGRGGTFFLGRSDGHHKARHLVIGWALPTKFRSCLVVPVLRCSGEPVQRLGLQIVFHSTRLHLSARFAGCESSGLEP